MSLISPIMLVYDGECPVCSAYCKALAIRQLDSHFEIVNARQHHPILEIINEMGVNMDDGFVLKIGNEYFHGADAIHRLALISTGVGPFNRLNYLIFQSAYLSKVLYPLLRTGRNILLRLLGRKKLDRAGLTVQKNQNSG
ncbi:MAG TPA: DCC1-like thiol-disulfide oxidoreductase family protein [Aestuariivirga sp.]|nr:DCC1-like thiol-disulfide oxidoreductase family protein [Aestuariivirga sp.]